MTTIDIDEATRNAILAALDERAARLEREINRIEFFQCGRIDSAHQYQFCPDCDGYSEDAQRALVWNIAALHETNMARLLVGEAEGETLAESGAWVKAEPWTDEQRAAAGGYHEWQSGR